MHRIAMWSGPRNISTALMRSFGNRPDCTVYDEPLYAHYLHKTGINHPYKNEIIQNGNIHWKLIVDELTGSIPNRKKVWYQKHMAHHILPKFNLNWINKLKNCILIRHPKEVILSYIAKFELDSIDQLGYRQQFRIYNELNEYPVIINSQDLLQNPEKILSKLCDCLNIVYYSEMLYWNSGSQYYDGVWGKYWYNSVKSSTSFLPFVSKEKKIPIRYNKIYDESLEIFDKLHSNRLC